MYGKRHKINEKKSKGNSNFKGGKIMKTYKVRYMECYEGTPEIVEAQNEKSIRKDFAKWKKKQDKY